MTTKYCDGYNGLYWITTCERDARITATANINGRVTVKHFCDSHADISRSLAKTRPSQFTVYEVVN